jgi:hypothetical protein
MEMTKSIKYEGKSFLNKQALYAYIVENKKMEMDNLKWSDPARFWFFVKYGKIQGKSVISGQPTEWNSVTERYERFANEKERQQYREDFKAKMMKKYGKTALTDEPDHQRKMLSNRSIGQKYTWLDGSTSEVTGNYEAHFLHFIETIYGFKKDYITEAPTIYYKDKDKVRFYLPDFYVPSLNVIIEIKGGNEHYQKRDEYKEKLKKDAAIREGFEFIQINDKLYTNFNIFFKEKVFDSQ